MVGSNSAIKLLFLTLVGYLARMIPSRIVARIPRFPFIMSCSLHGVVFKYFSNSFDALWKHAFDNFKYFEPNTISLFIQELRKRNAGVFLDVGSHSGLYGVIAMSLGYAATLCEPNPNLMLNQQMNLLLNHKISGRADLHCIALGEIRESKHLKIGVRKHSAVSSLAANVDELKLDRRILVQQTTLDDLNAIPAVIKIDVEGYEEYVLRGGLKTIEKYKPVIFMEALTQDALQSQLQILIPLGYKAPTVCGIHSHDARNYVWYPID